MAGNELLPVDYRERLSSLSLRAAWGAQIKAIMPLERPAQETMPHRWRYQESRGELLKAGDLVPVEQAERRVLALINPGYGPDQLSATPTIFLGLQLILPGEWAPNHRHTAAAARVIVEGEGAYTAVNGEKLPMAAGDVILTPPHYWHEHGHEGTAPMMWMDVLDTPVVVPAGASYLMRGERTPHLSNSPDSSETLYRCAGLIPYRSPKERRPDYPLMRYQWAKVRDALDAVAQYSAVGEPIHLLYTNPETGSSALKTFNFSARLIRPGETIEPPVTSASSVMQVFAGRGESEIDGYIFDWEEQDTLAVPCFAIARHRNLSSTKPAYLLQVDDVPMLEKLGYYEER